VVWFVILLALFRRHSYVNLRGMLGEMPWARRQWSRRGPPSTSALTQARDRLGTEPLERLFGASAKAWAAQSSGLVLANLRVLGIDGSTARTPDTQANRDWFGLPGSSRGRSAYPVLRTVLLVDIGTRLVLGARHGPFRTGETTLARQLLPEVPESSLVLLDRNFLTYEFLWDLGHQQRAQFVVRVKRRVRARRIASLGPGDDLVRIRIPRALLRRRKDLPRTWTLRRLTYQPAGARHPIRLFTSVLDPQALPAEDLATAYHQRWGVETGLDEIKTHLLDGTTVNRPVALRSLKPSRVDQEFYAVLTAYNLLRVLLATAASPLGLSPLRLSFVSALERVREAIRDRMALPTLRLPERYQRLLAALGSVAVPLRPGRSCPRAVKVKMSSYPCKKTRRAA
jgi:hypothetical protein